MARHKEHCGNNQCVCMKCENNVCPNCEMCHVGEMMITDCEDLIYGE